METLEQLKDIINSAPDGATHYDGKNYFRFEMYEHGQAYLVLRDGVWTRGLPAYPVYSCRSLSDIKLIIELTEERNGLKHKVGYVIEQPHSKDNYDLGA